MIKYKVPTYARYIVYTQTRVSIYYMCIVIYTSMYYMRSLNININTFCGFNRYLPCYYLYCKLKLHKLKHNFAKWWY